MSKKVDLAYIATTGSGGPLVADTLNANTAKIIAAFERTLSRDGLAPNQLQAHLDLNHNTLQHVRVRKDGLINAPHGGYLQ